MNKSATFASIVGTLLCLYLPASPAQAQATRTWVSGVGDDANPCSRTAPCKTFAGAISKTAAAGEINCIDPGGFGAVTITKSITIDCSEVFASVLVSGTNGHYAVGNCYQSGGTLSAPTILRTIVATIISKINPMRGNTHDGLCAALLFRAGADRRPSAHPDSFRPVPHRRDGHQCKDR